jgi:methionyl-tRNA synthetase
MRSITRPVAFGPGPMRAWICNGCKQRTAARLSTSTKPFYITTPIFYVNADPHLGHMYSMILADIIKRWQQLRGRKALLSTGIDEHGLKVQKAAEKADTPTQEFCDKGAGVFTVRLILEIEILQLT